MQNHYLEMITQTQALIARANEISESAETVTRVLTQHRTDVLTIQDMMTGRFEAIRKILEDDEENYRERFTTIIKELDQAITLIEGRKPEPVTLVSSSATETAEHINVTGVTDE